MSQVLYRKYRSQDFSQIFGQDSIKKVLTEAIKKNKVSHAYLFTGPRGTGKTSMARILAKSLNCSNKKGADPCNKCSNCQAINESRFMDLIEIDAASNRGIDEIRDLKEKIGFLPVEGLYKVYIIDEVHMLTSEAFNALLKTLEEPPDNVVFILATTEAHKLPLTIISRTQRFDFKSASDDQLKAKLEYILKCEKISYDSEVIDMIVNTAGGSFRDAESILEKVLSSIGYKKDSIINLEDVSSILGLADTKYIDLLIDYASQSNIEKSFEIIQQAGDSGVDFIQYIKQLLLKARRELTQNISGVAIKYDTYFLFVFIKEVLEAQERSRSSLVNTLPLEIAILNIVELLNNKGGKYDTKQQGLSLSSKSSSSGSMDSSNMSGLKSKDMDKTSDLTKKGGKQEVRLESKTEEKQKVQLVQEIQIEESVIDFDRVSTLWSQLIDDAKKANPHLAALLVNVFLKDYIDGRLLVEVPYSFHQKQLKSGKINNAFQGLAKNIYGCTLVLDIAINESLARNIKVEEESDDSNISVIEDVFGDFV